VLGVLDAHYFSKHLDPVHLLRYQTALRYLMFHVPVFFLISLRAEQPLARFRSLAVVASLFLMGIVFFCGTLLVTAIGAPDTLNRLAPIGGSILILAWLAIGPAWRRQT
jgi:uncharacterized membrane protein YgdD (TMEM256/DUF423 family)